MMAKARLYAFIAALFLYGVCGSPTPQSFGWAEGLIFVGLFFAAAPLRLLKLFELRARAPWPHLALGLLVYGLSVPLLVGLARGNDPSLIIRDIIPFLFLLLPLLFYDFIHHIPAHARLWIVASVAGIGILFSARVVGPFLIRAHFPIGMGGGDPLYLSIAPTVIFSAILLAGLSGQQLYRSCSVKAGLRSVLLMGLAAFPLGAMALTLQRATLGLWALSMGLLLLIAVIRNPARAVAPVVFVLICTAMLSPVISDLAGSLLHKQFQVGGNMRLQEAAAVFDQVGGSVLSTLFGHGWGATLASPAVGGVTVNFTHSLLTTFWLKTGLVGLGLVLLMLYGLCVPLLKILRATPVMALALGVPVVVDTVLYASFKSLDFGLILLLVSFWTTPPRSVVAVAPAPSMVYP